MRDGSLKRRLIAGAQIAGSAALAWFLFRGFDWPAFVAVARSLTPAFYVGSFLALAAGQLLFAWRWRIVLAAIGIRVPFADVARQYLIGMFFNNLLPGAVGGDAAKIYYLGRAAGYAEVGASVLVDRILGFAWLAFIGAPLAWTIGTPSPMFALNRALLTLFAAGFLVLLLGVRLLDVDRIAPAFIRRRGWFDRVRAIAGFIRAGATEPSALAAGAASTGAYISIITAIYLQFFSLAGTTVPAAAFVMLAIISAAIFVNVPISINGIGLREQVHYLLFSAVGVSKEAAVSISLLMFVHMLLVSLFGWFAWVRAQTATGPVPTSA